MRACGRRISDGKQRASALNPQPMKRWIVFLLLLALPIRTVLAVSGFGCAMMPMQKAHAESHGVPCPTHVVEGAAVETEAAADDASASCALVRFGVLRSTSARTHPSRRSRPDE